MKGIVGGIAKDSGKVYFGEEVLVVVYHGDDHVEAGGIILIYIDNMCKELIKQSL